MARLLAAFLGFLLFFTNFGSGLVLALGEGDLNSVYNDTVWYKTDSGGCSQGDTAGSSGDALVGSNNDEKVFNYFVGKGYTAIQAAGIVGNMVHESGVNPEKLQGGTVTKTPPVADGVGWGIVQWTPASKILDYARSVGKPAYEIETQLELLWKQLEGVVLSEKQAGDDLKATTNVRDAVLAFQGNTLVGGRYVGFERPRDQASSVPDRIAAAKATLRKYGGGSAPGAVQTTGSAGDCTCSANNSGAGTTVVLDPGHGPNFSQRDVATGLNMVESHNTPEITEAWDVAQKVKTQLEADGYTVLLTKQDVEGSDVTFRDRANVANSANAAIAVSIHDDHGQDYANFKQIYDQEVGAYRGSGSTKTTFTDAAIADKSKQYSQIFQQERQKVEGGSVEVKLNSFAGRAGLEPGNIPMVQLFSKVPWVYNEVGAKGNLSAGQKDEYAKGIVNGVEKSIPVSADAGTTPQPGGNCAGGAVSGNAVQTALNYAWANNRGDPYCKEKPAYKTAIDAAKAAGQYTGAPCNTDSSLAGVDCGGFVTRVMIDSGADPGYDYGGKLSDGAGNTTQQQKYLDEQVASGKYIKVGAVSNTSSLQPGDIAINSVHTFIYVGSQPGFEENSASASQGTRAPMARPAYFSNSAGDFIWYRLKG
jgi:N-acetylmuramoyl-L-alanine amidase